MLSKHVLFSLLILTLACSKSISAHKLEELKAKFDKEIQMARVELYNPTVLHIDYGTSGSAHNFGACAYPTENKTAYYAIFKSFIALQSMIAYIELNTDNIEANLHYRLLIVISQNSHIMSRLKEFIYHVYTDYRTSSLQNVLSEIEKIRRSFDKVLSP